MVSGRLKQYFIGTLASLTVVLSGMAYGWSAPIVKRLTANDSIIPMTEDQASWIYAAIELGDIFTPIPAGILADHFGRIVVLYSVIPFYLLGWSLVIFTRSVSMLFLVRILLGMCMGIIFGVCPLYIGEIAEPEIRGSLTSFITVLWYIGIFISYCVGPYVSYNTMAVIQLTAPIIVLLTVPLVPESPYYLLTKNKYNLAYKSLEKLRDKRKGSLKNELNVIKECLELDKAEKLLWTSLLFDPVCRKSLLMNCLIAAVCFFSGITIVYSYITEIFVSTGGNLLNPDLCTIFIGFVFLILSCLGASVIERFQRKTLLLVTAIGCGLSHLVSGAYFYLNIETNINVTDYSWILLVSMTSYCVFCVLGIQNIVIVYQGEIFPTGVKGIAGGALTVTSCTLSLIALKMFQVITSNFGIYSSLWSCTFCCFAGALAMQLYILETKGKPLVEIQRELKGASAITRSYIAVEQKERHFEREMA